MAILGTKVLAASFGVLGVLSAENNQVGTRQDGLEVPNNGYITRIGGYAFKSGTGNAFLWWGLYTLDESGAPSTLLARTDRLVVGAGGNVEGPVTWVNPLLLSTSQLAARMQAGERFLVAAKVETTGTAQVNLAITVAETTLYRRTYNVANTPPSSPFGAAGVVFSQGLALYVDFTENAKPSIAVGLPADGAVVTTVTPTFTATFTDPQGGSPTVDRMSAYQLEILRQVDNGEVFTGAASVFNATSQERSTGAISRVYSGPSLVTGTVYIWRMRVADDSGAWSDWSAYRVMEVAARGTVNLTFDGTPRTKIDTNTSTLAWTGRWNHSLAHAMDRVRVRVYRNGLLFRTGAQVVKSPAIASAAEPGQAFTVSAADAAIGELPPGRYTYTMEGRSATNQLWSPESAPQAFSVNSVPLVATNLQPPSGTSSTSYPILEWNIDDPDTDDVYGVDDTSDVEITNIATGVVNTYNTSNYDLDRGVGFLQLTGAHVPTAGTFRWRVRGKDTSAGADGIGQWSTYSTFNWVGAGPVVTVTNPTDGETEGTTAPNITWSNTGGAQVRARVLLYREDEPNAFKAWDIAGSKQNLIPAPGVLTKGGKYDLAVTVWLAGEVNGTSLRRRFYVDYAQPEAPTNIQVVPFMERRDHPFAPSSLMISWNPSIYPPGEFGGYNLYRRRADQLPSEATLLRTFSSPGQTRWRDAWPPTHTVLMYGVSQNRNIGGKLVESTITWVPGEIRLVIASLVSAKDPSKRFLLMYQERGPAGKTDRPKAYYTTWGSGNKRTRVAAPKKAAAQTVKLSVTVTSDARGTLYEHLADWNELAESGDPILYRAENPAERFYCDVDWEWAPGSVGERVFNMSLTEIDFTPGEGGGS